MDYWAMIFFIITTLNEGYLREYIRNKILSNNKLYVILNDSLQTIYNIYFIIDNNICNRK